MPLARLEQRAPSSALARSLREDRRHGDFPILADALQDAGCDNEDLLALLPRRRPRRRCKAPGLLAVPARQAAPEPDPLITTSVLPDDARHAEAERVGPLVRTRVVAVRRAAIHRVVVGTPRRAASGTTPSSAPSGLCGPSSRIRRRLAEPVAVAPLQDVAVHIVQPERIGLVLNPPWSAGPASSPKRRRRKAGCRRNYPSVEDADAEGFANVNGSFTSAPPRQAYSHSASVGRRYFRPAFRSAARGAGASCRTPARPPRRRSRRGSRWCRCWPRRRCSCPSFAVKARVLAHHCLVLLLRHLVDAHVEVLRLIP